MSAYRQSLQIALAGVQGPLPASLTSLAEEWGSPESPVQALYQAATLLTQAERSARLLPRQPDNPLPIAEAESLKAPEGAFAALLARGLDRPNAFVERDKADLLTARGEHLPHVLLPAWLNHLLTRPTVEQAALMACTGARGPWLAQLNPEWRPLLGQPSEAHHWETGSLDERAGWLMSLRGRDPTAGREALQGIWEHEAPEVRERLLACLSTGLCAEDEVFLETARKDKRKEVRRLALHLLAGLPTSSFAQRMMARAIEWLAYTPGGLLRAAKLEVRLPAAYDKAWSFDGIPEKTTRQHEKIGDKANWLVEVLSQVPLESLLQQLAIPPDNWAKLLAEHEYAAALWTGSMGSFERYPSPAMLTCLHSVPMTALKAKLVAVSLREAAESKDPDPWLSPLMTDDFDPLSTVAQLPRLDLPWSQRLFTQLKSQTTAQKGQPIYWGDLLSRFAERIHPRLLPDYLAFLDPLGDEPYIGKAVNAAVEIADLRHKLHQHRP